MAETAAPPQSGLLDVVSSHFDELSPQLKKAARYVVEHADDAALCSMRKLAEDAGLPPVTFVRLANQLGFDNYTDLRRVLQTRLRATGGNGRYSAKVRGLQQRGGSTPDLLRALFGAEVENLDVMLQTNSSDAWLGAVELIERAKNVYVLGQRSCYPPAFLFHYVYRLVHSNAKLLDDVAGTIVDDLRHIDEHAVVIAISVSPYSTAVVQTVMYARDQGARVVAITDDPLSPIARGADGTLLINADTPSFFPTVVPIVALVQALLALLVMRGDAEALAGIEYAEQQLDRYHAYWPDASQRSRRE